MPNAQHLRAQIEASLAERIPSALTPQARVACPVSPTGIPEMDLLLRGGLPVGAISEIVGPECSGRTSFALTFVAGMTQAGKVCAWVDASDSLHPESAAALGVDLSRLLWIRCGSSPAPVPLCHSAVRGIRMNEKPAKIKPGLPVGGGGHPRMEAAGLSAAVTDLFSSSEIAPRCAEPIRKLRPQRQQPAAPALPVTPIKATPRSKSWSRLEQALRVTDLLLQAGGFSSIVLDLGSMQSEYALRVPLATWFRFRSASERLQTNFLLLTQHACSKSSAGLVIRFEPRHVLTSESTLFSCLDSQATLERQRFPQSPGNVLPLRKQPQSVHTAQWRNQAVWAGRR